MSEPEVIIGIDLGTTFSCVACYDKNANKVEVIESPSVSYLMSFLRELFIFRLLSNHVN